MKKVDYIIVGAGIAGITICDRLEIAGLDFAVIDSSQNVATKIAGGVVNPIVLKRFNPVWKANEFISEASSFYLQLAEKLDESFLSFPPLKRIFFNTEEQNDWMVASDSPLLEPFMASEVETNNNPCINATLGFGKVRTAFRIDTDLLLSSYHKWLRSCDRYVNEEFDFHELTVGSDLVRYKNISARKIIFAQGASAVNNPYFISSCIIPKKGEYIVFRATDLKLDAVLKGPFFIIPLGNHLYQAGATFAHGDTEHGITEKGRIKLENGISKMINCPFEVVYQLAGMRPTTADRRPVLGSAGNERLLFFNGLGTRGLLTAPLLSKWLLFYSENDTKLPTEVDVKRFIE